jgi:hypothetical protein
MARIWASWPFYDQPEWVGVCNPKIMEPKKRMMADEKNGG